MGYLGWRYPNSLVYGLSLEFGDILMIGCKGYDWEFGLRAYMVSLRRAASIALCVVIQ